MSLSLLTIFASFLAVDVRSAVYHNLWLSRQPGQDLVGVLTQQRLAIERP